MVPTDSSNFIFQLASDFVQHTARHIFLTGKAGTGKTTFLKQVKSSTQKNTVIVAPTGVAAINAGGVTMHSFFQLPFGPFIPATQRGFSDSGAEDRHSLFKNIRFNSDKRALLQELELLIIDEVSMVRADMLDAMDTILRHYRKKPATPFGGVQVVYIGDMYQLPPVVSGNEWEVLQHYYDTPFFFSAKATEEAPPLYIELKKIYRQNEQRFIDLLNRVRNNNLTQDDFDLLNSKYDPSFNPPAGEKYITLTTHNKKADTINASELEKLRTPARQFTGVLEGDFSDKALPTDIHLHLKEGAQVMFLKNDSGGERKYFNGKLATIKKIRGDDIIVTTNEEGAEIKLEKETWRNIRYTFNKQSDSIEEEELGSFTQYPIRLAWAITVHKSQGLTFEKAIIDAGASFAAGQVYVALSRCTSLNGLVLFSKIYPSSIATDPRIIAFAQREAEADQLQQLFQQEAQQYRAQGLLNTFNWNKLLRALEAFEVGSLSNKLPNYRVAKALSNTLLTKANEHSVVAGRFGQQLQQIVALMLQTNNTALLEERMGKAIAYFAGAIIQDLLLPLQEHLASLGKSTKLKKYRADVTGLISALKHQLSLIIDASYGDTVFCKEKSIYEPYLLACTPSEKPIKNERPLKGSSPLESLSLLRNGHTMKDIAQQRNLSEGTIAGHLATFVRTGALDIHELVPEERVTRILPIVKEIGGQSIMPIKEKLGDDYSFYEIRAVLNYWYWLQDKNVIL